MLDPDNLKATLDTLQRAAADFSRIRRANLGRFTVDRLMTILGRLDQEVDVTVNVRPRSKGDEAAAGLHP